MEYKRILLKVSGEALAHNNKQNGIYDKATMKQLVNFVKSFVHFKKIELAIVVGAGNIWRGKNAKEIGFDAAKADYMGMLGTVINAMAISDTLNQNGVKSVVLSAFEIEGMVEKTSSEKAKQLLSEGYVVVFAGGTGKPFFSTDTGATLRALEIEADAIIMAKDGVDGVYTKNPLVYPDALRIASATYQELIDLKIEAMDLSALEMLKDTAIHLLVIGMDEVRSFETIEEHIKIGTIITRGK